MGDESFACLPDPGGCRLEVKAHPGANRDGVDGVHDGRLRVRVTAAPEKGKANKALLAVLAKSLGVARSALTIVAGETSPRKTIRVCGCGPAEARRRLTPHLGKDSEDG